jgi:hypothetical protein
MKVRREGAREGWHQGGREGGRERECVRVGKCVLVCVFDHVCVLSVRVLTNVCLFTVCITICGMCVRVCVCVCARGGCGKGLLCKCVCFMYPRQYIGVLVWKGGATLPPTLPPSLPLALPPSLPPLLSPHRSINRMIIVCRENKQNDHRVL